MSRNLLLGFLFLLTLNISQVFASLLAIDYGSEWIKASLMKPGVPFDVLLNKDSKRKIQSSVGWKNDDRLFGSDAYNLVSRHRAHLTDRSSLTLRRPRDSQQTRSIS